MTDLFDLIEPLKREVNSIGVDSFPDAITADWLGNLQDGFWEAVLDGTIDAATYSEEEGEVTPDLPQELQRLIVFYAGLRIVRNQLRQLNTLFRAKAGNVEYETRQDWQILKALLQDMIDRRAVFIQNLSAEGVISSQYYDGLAARDSSIYYGDTHWVE